MPIFDDSFIAPLGFIDSYDERMTAFSAASAVLRAIPHLMHEMEKDGLIKPLHHRTVFEAEAFIVDFINDIPSLSKHDVEKRYDLIHQTEQ